MKQVCLPRVLMVPVLLVLALAPAAFAVKRETWNNCTCKAEWQEAVGMKCTNSCCNPDDDPHGDWCMVEDQACEDSDWGYCHPEGTCRDEIDWADDSGLDCIDYAHNRYCTTDGKPGPGWDPAWGTFADFADYRGNTAAQVCCACGGGADSVHLVSNGVACFDLTWADASGDDCGTYKTNGYCTKRGLPGPGWHEEWGKFQKFAAKGNLSMPGGINRTIPIPVNATRACCACGGGVTRKTMPTKGAWLKNNKQAAKHIFEEVNKQGRRTWNGCQCKKIWNDTEDDAECDSFCCNKDKDPYGAWCVVKDAACEDADWGYCRPPPGKFWKAKKTVQKKIFRLCTDSPLWHDADGDSCGDYGENMWCNMKGAYGPGWHQEWGGFADFASTGGAGKGSDALEACCACGGGVRPHVDGESEARLKFNPFEKITAVKMTLVGKYVNVENRSRRTWGNCNCSKSWKDVATGFQCDNYCCNPDSDSNGAWCNVEKPECEDATWGYCRPKKSAWDFIRKETCVNAPSDFKDTEGYTCTDYEREHFCNRTGGPSFGWNPNWGTLDDNADANGETGYTACCACGGGARAPELKHCQDIPGWVDKDGDTCASYYTMRWCAPPNYSIDGGGSRYGAGWKDEWGSFGDFAATGNPQSSVILQIQGKQKEANALDACCACGGGILGHKESTWRWEKRMEQAEDLVENTYGAVLFVPALCCCSCWVGLFYLWKRSKIPLDELPAVATHAARKYGKFDDGKI